MRTSTLLLSLAAAGGLLGALGCGGYSDSGYTYYQSNAVAIGDLNKDGTLDLVSAKGAYGDSIYGYLSVYTQSGGALNGPNFFNSGPDALNMALKDLNGDGYPDVVLADDETGTLTVMLQDAAHPGSFLAPTHLSLGGRNAVDVAVGDLNGDGRPDIAVAADGGASVLVFFQNPDGSFAAPASFPTTGTPQAVAIGDLDGDGRNDLAVATSSSVVSVLIQSATTPGSFAAPSDVPVGPNPIAVKLGDLNGDGRLDIATANFANSASGLSVALQSSTTAGTFGAATNYDTGDAYSDALAIGDLNGDGRMDIVVCNYGVYGSPGSFSVLYQDAATAGSFDSAQVYLGAYGPTSVAIGDLNGDGLPDLAIADGGTWVYTHQPAGSSSPFSRKQQISGDTTGTLPARPGYRKH